MCQISTWWKTAKRRNKTCLHISAGIWILSEERKNCYGDMGKIGICVVVLSLIVESEDITTQMFLKAFLDGVLDFNPTIKAYSTIYKLSHSMLHIYTNFCFWGREKIVRKKKGGKSLLYSQPTLQFTLPEHQKHLKEL